MTGKCPQRQNRNLSDCLPKKAVYLSHLETKGPHQHRQVHPGSKWWLARLTKHPNYLPNKVHMTTTILGPKLLY